MPSAQFQKRLYIKAALFALVFLLLAISSSLAGKFLDNKYATYPTYSLALFFCSFVVSWLVVILVLKKTHSEISSQEQRQNLNTKNLIHRTEEGEKAE